MGLNGDLARRVAPELDPIDGLRLVTPRGDERVRVDSESTSINTRSLVTCANTPLLSLSSSTAAYFSGTVQRPPQRAARFSVRTRGPPKDTFVYC